MSRHEGLGGRQAARMPHGVTPLAPPWAPIATMFAVLVTSMIAGLVWHSDRLGSVDAWALRELGAHTYREFRLASAISTSLRPVAIGGTLAIAALAWVALRRRNAVLLSLAAPALTLAAEKLLKQLVGRRWPGSSVLLYPSGHLAVATALALTLVLIARSARARPSIRLTVAMSASLFVLVMARARLAQTTHSLSDVVGGVATGVGVTLAVALLLDSRLLSLMGDRHGSSRRSDPESG